MGGKSARGKVEVKSDVQKGVHLGVKSCEVKYTLNAIINREGGYFTPTHVSSKDEF